jgi:hypothetical protein
MIFPVPGMSPDSLHLLLEIILSTKPEVGVGSPAWPELGFFLCLSLVEVWNPRADEKFLFSATAPHPLVMKLLQELGRGSSVDCLKACYTFCGLGWSGIPFPTEFVPFPNPEPFLLSIDSPKLRNNYYFQNDIGLRQCSCKLMLQYLALTYSTSYQKCWQCLKTLGNSKIQSGVD